MGAGAQRRPPVTVAVVSYDTRELLVGCLRSLAAEVESGRADVWVVDNGSRDGSAQAARECAPWARVLEPEANLGFGSAVNLVARQTKSEWLACANADIALEPGALEALLDAGGDPRVGCVAPRLLSPDGSTQSSLHSLPTIPFTLALNLGLYRLGAGVADRLLIPGRYDLERPRDAPWALGAFLLLRRSAFDAVGGFDERQWMYAEDLDLGWRLREAGWRTRYEPRARVRHESGAATESAFGADRVPRFMRATYAVILRRRGRVVTWTTAAINVLGAGVRICWMAPLGLLAPRFRAAAASNRDWLLAHRQGLRAPRALERESTGTPAATGTVRRDRQMRRFWNDRAREDALYFVDTRQRYRGADPEHFWDAEPLLDYVLGGLGAAIAPGDTVVEIGCGVGRITRALAGRTRRVIAVDVSDEMLRLARELNPDLSNVEWVLGDGVSLRGLGDGTVDACVSLVVFQHLPDPAIGLGYVKEIGRVLKPGGWAALQVSNDPSAHRPRTGPWAHAKAWLGLAPRGQRDPAWLGSPVELPALAAAAAARGLELARVWGEGSQFCQVLLRKAD